MPRDLYAAFQTRYAGFGMGQPSFVVGKLPTPEMDPLVPAGATVLGGVVIRTRSGAIQISSAAMMMPGVAREAQARMIDHLKSKGFRQAVTPGRNEEGFTSTASQFGPFNYYCGDSTQVNVTSQDRYEGGTYIVLQVDRVRENRSICGTQSRMSMMGRMRTPSELTFPVLDPPDKSVGRETGGSGWSSDANMRTITAEVESDLSAEAIVDHYTKEFVKNGWKAIKRFKQDKVVIQLLRSESGRNVREVVLTNVQLPDKSHNVTAQIHALQQRKAP